MGSADSGALLDEDELERWADRKARVILHPEKGIYFALGTREKCVMLVKYALIEARKLGRGDNNSLKS